MVAAPLMAGNDLRAHGAATRSMLTNSEVIAVDQDSLGIQGHRVSKVGNSEVWVKPLAGGGRAVLLFNRGETQALIRATADQLGWPPQMHATVRDLWGHKAAGRWTGTLLTSVDPHGVAMFRVTP